jgi:hypothetical protein
MNPKRARIHLRGSHGEHSSGLESDSQLVNSRDATRLTDELLVTVSNPLAI